METEIAVVGGGPAGLAAAIACAKRGLGVVVLERQRGAIDKACGEGLLPPARAALDALGVLPEIERSAYGPFLTLRYVDGEQTAEARLPDGGGLGVRRTALTRALRDRAVALGVRLIEGVTARDHRREGDRMVVRTDGEPLVAQLLIGADGLGSRLRAAEGLDCAVEGPRRFGLRQHFAPTEPGDRVEVHFAPGLPGLEAYLTPAGPARLGVALLWEDGLFDGKVTFDRLLGYFPALAARLNGVERDSRPRGAGPLARRAQRCVADRFVLLGDAAGYLDAITGEGLSLAFAGARSLGEIAPEALLRGASVRSLEGYARGCRSRYARYLHVTRAVLWLSRRPRLRRQLLRFLAGHPRIFDRMVAFGLPA